MRYRVTDDGLTYDSDLEAEQVAKLTASGAKLEILRRGYYTRADGAHVGEYTDTEHAALLADGWTLAKQLAEGEDVAPPPPPAPVCHYSEVAILDALAARGMEEAFCAFLEANPPFKRRWDAATYLSSHYAPFIDGFTAAMNALGMTADEANQLLAECRI